MLLTLYQSYWFWYYSMVMGLHLSFNGYKWNCCFPNQKSSLYITFWKESCLRGKGLNPRGSCVRTHEELHTGDQKPLYLLVVRRIETNFPGAPLISKFFPHFSLTSSEVSMTTFQWNWIGAEEIGCKGKEKEKSQKLALENESSSWFPDWPDCVYMKFANVGQKGIISLLKCAKEIISSNVTIFNSLKPFLKERITWHKTSLQMKWQKIDTVALV